MPTKLPAGPASRRGGGRSSARRRRPITAEDVARFRSVSTPRISPDGESLVYSVKCVGDANDDRSQIWVADADGGAPRAVTNGERDGRPEWSPDGSTVAFVRAADRERPQLALLPVDGGEARTLTDFPEGVIAAYRWAPDGKSLAVSFREQAPEWTKDAREDRERRGLSDPPRVIDDPWYRLDGDGYFEAQRFRLYIVDARSGDHRLVYDQDRYAELSFDFSPDSKQLALCTVRHKQGFARWWTAEIVRLDVASGRVTPLANVPAGLKAGVAWSPDGRFIAWAGTDDEDGTRQGHNHELWTCDAVEGGARSLTSREDFCLLAPTISDTGEVEFAAGFRWAPDSRRIWMQLGWHGETHLASVAARGGRIQLHTKGRKQFRLGDFCDDGSRLALTVESVTRPAEVAVAEVPRIPARASNGEAPILEPRRLSDVNGELLKELELAKPTSAWVRSADGTRVQMWTMLPPGASARRKRPAVLEIHGGPHAQYGWAFFHEFQLLAANGYIVFYSNPRGSKGYGQDHCDGNSDAWGGPDWEDLQAVTTHMEEQSFVDADRMGIMGGSFGGYMTLWAIGHTRKFRAAIADRCVSNMVSIWGASDIYLWPDTYFSGNGWDDTEHAWNLSPLKYLGRAKTPTLLIHSEGDLRCNIAESEQVHAALSLLGVPCRFVRYPRNTSHGMSRGGPPDMRVHRLGQILGWWDRWLRRRR